MQMAVCINCSGSQNLGCLSPPRFFMEIFHSWDIGVMVKLHDKNAIFNDVAKVSSKL